MISAWRPSSGLLSSVALGIGYFGLAAAAVLTTRFEGGVAFLWVASGLMLARLLVLPPSRWYGPILSCAVASPLATALFGLGPIAAPLLQPGNLGEVVGAAWLLRCWLKRSAYLDSIRGLFAFVVVAGIAMPAISGLNGAAVAHMVTGRPFADNWVAWFSGHALGTIVTTPIATLLLSGEARRWVADSSLLKRLESAGLLCIVAGTCAAVFGQDRLPILFLPMLPMMVATIRIGRFGAAASVAILALVGGALTLAGNGPIHLIGGTAGRHAMFFQFFLATSAMIVLPVAALLKQVRELIAQLADVQAQFRLIAAHSSDAILTTDAQGTITFASQAVRELAGADPGTLVGRPISDIVTGEDRARAEQALARALANPPGPFSSEYRLEREDGGSHWFETNSNVVVGPNGETSGMVTLIREVTERKVTEEALTVAATTDPLTGLPNRRAFTAALEICAGKVRDHGSRCCVAIFDLDHFKAVNDRFGHGAGDHVLQAFASVASGTLRQGDLIARIGGEEFAVVLRGASMIEARQVCNRVREALAAQSLELPGGQAIAVTTSVGIAAVSADADFHAVLDQADAALYRAKAAGRNCLRAAA